MNPGARARLVAAIGATVAALVVPLTQSSEGRVKRAYTDPVGILTACDGHTGQGVKPGQTYTDDQCDDLLASDLMAHDADISKCIPMSKLTPGQHSAFLDFAINVGSARFCSSTMAQMVRIGHPEEACKEFPRWVYAGGRKLPGLVRRRAREQAMCEGQS